MHWGTIAIRGLWPAAFLMTGATTLALLARADPYFAFDLAILIQTVEVVLFGRGAR